MRARSPSTGRLDDRARLRDDAYTHKRIYLLEMMGNRSGRDVVQSGVASRAHLIVLPFFRFPERVIEEIAAALSGADMALLECTQP